MKKLMIFSLLAATAFPAAAQDAACEIDLGSAVMLLVQAQGLASSGDTETALTFIDLAQSKLDGFEALCGAAVVDDPVTPVEVALTQTFTIEDSFDGNLTFSYPEGWAQGEDGGILIATASQILDRSFTNEPPPFFTGEALIFVDLGRASDFTRGDASTPLEIVTQLSLEIPSSFGPLTAPEALTINDRPAALFTVTGVRAHLIVMSVQLDTLDGEPMTTQFILLTAPGELDQFEPTLTAIAESLVYDAP